MEPETYHWLVGRVSKGYNTISIGTGGTDIELSLSPPLIWIHINGRVRALGSRSHLSSVDPPTGPSPWHPNIRIYRIFITPLIAPQFGPIFATIFRIRSTSVQREKSISVHVTPVTAFQGNRLF